MIKFFLMFSLLISIPFNCFAAIINIPGDQPNIQAGIDSASSGDTILIADGTYSGSGNYNITISDIPITVKSIKGPDNCIIDCQQLGSAFSISKDSTIEGLTIKNAKSAGGAINASGIDLTVTNCIFKDNVSSENGGAVYSGKFAVFTQCKFDNNRCSTQGYNGGAVCAFAAIFDHCRFTNNVSSYFGGAVYCTYFSFAGCLFKDNRTYLQGGAVYLSSRNGNPYSLDLGFTNCIFVNNVTTGTSGKGGAVFFYAYFYDDYSCFLANCTITNNRSERGGAVYSYLNETSSSALMTIKNCIIWGNPASAGNEIDMHGKSPTVIYSDVKNGYSGEGNINQDPLFLTIESNRELYLHPDSPCIDSATADGAPGDDFDGTIRPVGVGDDMGAYEYCNDIFIWEGQNSDWDDVGNWHSNAVPGSSDMVILSSSAAMANPVLTSVNNAEVRKIFIQSGVITIEHGKLSVGGS